MMFESNVPSPCTAVCRLDPETGFCQGCFRTAAEIGGWPLADRAARIEILARLRERRRAASRTGVADSRPRRRRRPKVPL